MRFSRASALAVVALSATAANAAIVNAAPIDIEAREARNGRNTAKLESLSGIVSAGTGIVDGVRSLWQSITSRDLDEAFLAIEARDVELAARGEGIWAREADKDVDQLLKGLETREADKDVDQLLKGLETRDPRGGRNTAKLEGFSNILNIGTGIVDGVRGLWSTLTSRDLDDAFLAIEARDADEDFVNSLGRRGADKKVEDFINSLETRDVDSDFVNSLGRREADKKVEDFINSLETRDADDAFVNSLGRREADKKVEDFINSLETRDADDAFVNGLTARDLDADLNTRDVEDISAREASPEPLFGKKKKPQNNRDPNAPSRLETFGNAGNAIGGGLSAVNGVIDTFKPAPARRDIEEAEIEAREASPEPLFGKKKKQDNKPKNRDPNAPSRLETFGNAGNAIGGGLSAVNGVIDTFKPAPARRDIEEAEIEAREASPEPLFGKKKKPEGLPNNKPKNRDPNAPSRLETFGNAGNAIGGGLSAVNGVIDTFKPAPARRDIEEAEIEAREASPEPLFGKKKKPQSNRDPNAPSRLETAGNVGGAISNVVSSVQGIWDTIRGQ